jgi:RHS repeat-associated protein
VHTDQQGSIQAVTDASGNEVKRKEYAAFGSLTAATGPLAREARGFTGQRQEDATGLLYLHSRYYDPQLGRFVSPNPIVDGDDTIGLNRYVYAANNPVNNADKTGLDCTKGDAKCDRNNWHNYGQQKHLEYSCGPAAVRVALSAQGVVVDDESELYGPLGTSITDGTDSIGGNVVPFLNARLNTTFYEAKDIPGSKADQEHIDQLKADIVTDINANRPIVANVTIGAAQDTDGDYHQYGGHYITIVGYDDHGNVAHIYDSADVHHVNQYWMSTDNLATWIAGKGYAG